MLPLVILDRVTSLQTINVTMSPSHCSSYAVTLSQCYINIVRDNYIISDTVTETVSSTAD